jgi:hypothetical protein
MDYSLQKSDYDYKLIQARAQEQEEMMQQQMRPNIFH